MQIDPEKFRVEKGYRLFAKKAYAPGVYYLLWGHVDMVQHGIWSMDVFKSSKLTMECCNMRMFVCVVATMFGKEYKDIAEKYKGYEIAVEFI